MPLSREQLEAARSIVEASTDYDAAFRTILRTIDPTTNKNALHHQFVRAWHSAPTEFLGRALSSGEPCHVAKGLPDLDATPFSPVSVPAFREAPETALDVSVAHRASVPASAGVPRVAERQPKIDPEISRLIEQTKRGPVGFADLCNLLDMSPSRTARLIDRAKAGGVAVNVEHDHVGFALPEPSADVVETGVAPTTSGRQVVGVISDTHFGSKYCMRDQIRDFVHHAYRAGAREILHAGDVLDGCYKHGLFELSHSGIEDQARDAFETLPRLDGLTYHAISGNHDDTFADSTGMAPGDYISWHFREHGRNDVRFYGRRGAYLKLRGATVELWHPKKSGSYSLSYHLQNKIRDLAVGQKPDVLIAGHWHTFVYLEQRGVHALAAGTFQAGGSAFSKSLGGAPSIGGTILSWELTETRTLRRFGVERVTYYEREELRELELA